MPHIYQSKKSGEYTVSNGYDRKKLDADKDLVLVTDPKEVTKARAAIKEKKAE